MLTPEQNYRELGADERGGGGLHIGLSTVCMRHSRVALHTSYIRSDARGTFGPNNF